MYNKLKGLLNIIIDVNEKMDTAKSSYQTTI